MEKKGLDKKKKIFIVVFPIVFMLLCFVFYNLIFSNKGEKNVATNSEALLVPDVDQPVKDLSSKWDVLERKDSIISAQERQNIMKGNDDFFSDIPNNKQEKVEQETESPLTSRIEVVYQDPLMDMPLETKKPIAKENSPFDDHKPTKKETPKPVAKKAFGFSDEQKKEIFGNTETEFVKSTNAKKDENEEKPVEKRRGFYSADGTSTSAKTKSSSKETDEIIPCVVHNDQLIKGGGTVRLRITKDCKIAGMDVPKNTPVTGKASLGQERLFIEITSIKLGDQIIATKLSAFEMDGNPGVYAPGTTNQEIAQQAAQSGAGSVSSSISVPMMGTVSFGAKKKLADPSVRITSGYKLILKQNLQ